MKPAKNYLRDKLKPRFPLFWKMGKSAWKLVEGAVGLRSYPRYTYYKELDTIFISISKNANSTINRMFLDKLGIDYDPENYHSIHGPKHDRSISQRKFLRLDTEDIFVFAFSRNPLTRLVSAYENKVVQESYQPIMQNYFGAIYPDMPFAEFVRAVCRIPDWWSDEHFRSQSSDIFPRGKDKVDYIGSVENLSEDIQPVRNKLGLPQPKTTNTTKSKSERDMSDYYTQDLAAAIYRRYRDDFKNFNYEDEYREILKTLKP